MRIEKITALLDQINEKSKRYEADFESYKGCFKAKIHRNDDGVEVLNIDADRLDDDYEAEIMASLAYVQALFQHIDKSAQRDRA